MEIVIFVGRKKNRGNRWQRAATEHARGTELIEQGWRMGFVRGSTGAKMGSVSSARAGVFQIALRDFC